MSRASIHNISFGLNCIFFVGDGFNIDIENYLSLLNLNMKHLHDLIKDIKIGDIIRIVEINEVYPSYGLMIYGRNNLSIIGAEIPKEFLTPTLFDPYYWSDIIVIKVPIDIKSFRAEMAKNITITYKSVLSTFSKYRTIFYHDNKRSKEDLKYNFLKWLSLDSDYVTIVNGNTYIISDIYISGDLNNIYDQMISFFNERKTKLRKIISKLETIFQVNDRLKDNINNLNPLMQSFDETHNYLCELEYIIRRTIKI